MKPQTFTPIKMILIALFLRFPDMGRKWRYHALASVFYRSRHLYRKKENEKAALFYGEPLFAIRRYEASQLRCL